MLSPVEVFRQRLQAGPLLLDGAVGTELERRRVHCPAPLWSAAVLLEAPQIVDDIHRTYIDAGADIIVANTFRTNPRALRAAGRFADGGALNTTAVRVARRAVGRREVFVAASVGPVADCYTPEDTPAPGPLLDEHRQMMAWLASAEPDLVWIETIGTVREAAAAACAACERALPFTVSFVARSDACLLSGEPLAEAVRVVEEFAPLAIGLNCVPPTGLTELLPRLGVLTARPLMAYAHIHNAAPIRGWSYVESPAPPRYAEHVRAWVAAGARVVGGCCGTTPEHIAAVRQQLDTTGSSSV